MSPSSTWSLNAVVPQGSVLHLIHVTFCPRKISSYTWVLNNSDFQTRTWTDQSHICRVNCLCVYPSWYLIDTWPLACPQSNSAHFAHPQTFKCPPLHPCYFWHLLFSCYSIFNSNPSVLPFIPINTTIFLYHSHPNHHHLPPGPLP